MSADLATLLAGLKSELATVLAGQIFSAPPDGTPMAPRVFIGSLPPKRSVSGQGEDYPFVVVRGKKGDDNLTLSRAEVWLLCAIYTGDDVEAGALAVHRLIDVLRAWLPLHRNCVPDFRMEPDLHWEFGDDQDGLQPHPYYHGKIVVFFKAQPLARSRRPVPSP